MKLQEFTDQLQNLEQLRFRLPDAPGFPCSQPAYVSDHFHITEVGILIKQFIDCGGKAREHKFINFQLWFADDVDHRLSPKKLIDIINLAQEVLYLQNLEIEVEHQHGTIGKFGLEFDGTDFQLTVKQTDCLAKEKCLPVIENSCDTEGCC